MTCVSRVDYLWSRLTSSIVADTLPIEVLFFNTFIITHKNLFIYTTKLLLFIMLIVSCAIGTIAKIIGLAV